MMRVSLDYSENDKGFILDFGDLEYKSILLITL